MDFREYPRVPWGLQVLAELRAAPGRQVGGLQPSRNEGWQGGAHHTYAKPRVIERSYEVFAELRDAPRPLYRLGSVLDIIQRLPELPGTQVSVCCLLLVAAAAIFTLWSPTLYLSSSFCCAVDGLLVLPRAPL